MKFPNGSRLTAEDQLRMNERINKHYLNGRRLLTGKEMRARRHRMLADDFAYKGDPIPCTWPQYYWMRRRLRINNLIALGMIAFNLLAPMGIIWFLWR